MNHRFGLRKRHPPAPNQPPNQLWIRFEAVSQQAVARMKLFERFPGLFGQIQLLTAALYGPASSLERAKQFTGRLLSIFVGILLSTAILSLAAGEWVFLQLGICFSLLFPLYAYKQLEGKVKVRRRRILLDLPELLNKITLLVQAGETVPQAIHRCAFGGKPGRPLYDELNRLSLEVKDSRPFHLGLEDFGKRCGTQEVSMFCTTVLLNYKRGGGDLAAALNELSRMLWEKRKALAKTMGEESSTKLVFPMMFMFLVVMIMVAAPAIMLMNGYSS